MNLHQRVILVDVPHLVFVARQGVGKQRLVHAGAVGAFQIVEVDHRDLGRWIAANGPAGNVDRKQRVLVQAESVQVGQGLAVGGDEEVDHRLLGPWPRVMGSVS